MSEERRPFLGTEESDTGDDEVGLPQDLQEVDEETYNRHLFADVDVDADVDADKQTTSDPQAPKYLFGLPLGFVLISLYVILWTAHVMVVRLSQNSDRKRYDYDVFAVLAVSEFLKCCFATIHNRREVSPTLKNTWNMVWEYKSEGVKFLIPAFVYSLYNLLIFMNLLSLNPGVYQVMTNLRIVFSGVLFQFIFSKKLGKRKWTALFVLTFGCMLAKMDEFSLSALDGIEWMLIQALLSSLAGVINEFLFKKDLRTHLSVQNIWIYSFGCLCNVVLSMFTRSDDISWYSLAPFGFIFDLPVFFVTFVSATAGFSTSFILRNLTILHKEFANAIEMVTVAIFSWIFFDIPVTPYLMIAIVTTSSSLYMYNT